MPVSRSENMRRIRSKNTVPELTVRKMIRELGFNGYRLHRNDLPGKPDIAFISKKKAIQIHGCFWHGHTCKVGMRVPKSNLGYWIPKIQRTKERDIKNIMKLKELGWNVLTVWECELKDRSLLSKKLQAFLSI